MQATYLKYAFDNFKDVAQLAKKLNSFLGQRKEAKQNRIEEEETAAFQARVRGTLPGMDTYHGFGDVQAQIRPRLQAALAAGDTEEATRQMSAAKQIQDNAQKNLNQTIDDAYRAHDELMEARESGDPARIAAATQTYNNAMQGYGFAETTMHQSLDPMIAAMEADYTARTGQPAPQVENPTAPHPRSAEFAAFKLGDEASVQAIDAEALAAQSEEALADYEGGRISLADLDNILNQRYASIRDLIHRVSTSWAVANRDPGNEALQIANFEATVRYNAARGRLEATYDAAVAGGYLPDTRLPDGPAEDARAGPVYAAGVASGRIPSFDAPAAPD